jgi:hypothetical protein
MSSGVARINCPAAKFGYLQDARAATNAAIRSLTGAISSNGSEIESRILECPVPG